MKKVLSMLLALAMVLTMAAFPAFAEDELTKATLTYVRDTNTHYMNNKPFENAVDGSDTTSWVSDQYGNGVQRDTNIDVVFELAEAGMLDTLIIKWGAADWGYQAPNKYNIAVSADDETYTTILSYDALYDLAKGTSDSPNGGTIECTNASNAYKRYNITETGLNAKNVKYIKIEIRNAKYRPSIYEIYAYTKSTDDLVPAAYTVKYQYADGTEALAPKTVEGNFVGDTVRETAPAITGYNVDEASKEITLVDGTNEIVFTYTAREAATYTVEYVDAEGNPVADAKEVTTGFYADDKVTETAVTVAGYKPTETSKEVTLAAGANTITFIYNAAESVTYTVNYVDAAGNPIADAKTVTAYEGDVVTETAVAVAGYFLDGTEFAKNVTLAVDADNDITFTYKKVLVPTKVSATYAAGVSNSGGNDIDWKSFYDGNVNRTVQYAPVGASYVAGTSPMIVTYAFAELTDFTKLTTLSSGNRADSVKIYTSMNGNDWIEVGTYEPKTTETKVVFTKADGTALTTYANEYDLTGKSGTQIRFEVLASPAGAWCGIYEMMVEGTAKETASVDADGVKPTSKWGWKTDSMTKSDVSVLFDGAPASNLEGYFSQGYFGAASQPKAGELDLEIDLGAVYDNPIITIQGGAPDWNYAHLMAYEIYVAGIDGVYGEAPVSGFDNGTNADVNKVRTDIHQISAEGVRYVKIVPTYVLRRVVLGEISVYSTPVDLTAEPEKAGASLGGQIRLPSGKVPAGLRFGATIAKDVFGDVLTDGYNYSELAAAGIKVGMFILPIDLLDGNATLADYIANDGDKALDIAAERIYAEDDFAVTFTAVVTSIPEKDYARKVVAAPYICVDGVYTFYAEMTRDYTTVTEAVAADYEAGVITLTADQVTLIEGILGRTLVAPEVSE